MGIEKALSDHLKKFSAGPILFVGSGISRRYLNAPDWRTLLAELAGLTRFEYGYYKSSTNDQPSKMAEMLVDPLHDRIWSESEEPFRKEHIDSLVNRDSALKIYAAEQVRGVCSNRTAEPVLLEEIGLLEECKENIDAVITTNYDRFMEEIFPDYRVFTGQDELLLNETAGVGEIYKVHGSVDDPNTIVFTEADYRAFRERNSYLVAKLLTFFAEHPIVFLGYSLDDPNIQDILHSLRSCLTGKNLSVLRDKLIFVEWSPAVSSPTMTDSYVSVDTVPIPVKLITASDFRPIFKALRNVEPKVPKRILRQIQEKLYRIILDPSSEAKLLHVRNIDNISPDDEMVIGLGVIADIQQRGYRGVSRVELCRDSIETVSGLDYESIVGVTFRQLLQAPGNFPVFRALREAGFLDSDGNVKKPESLPPKVVERANDISRIRISSSLTRKAELIWSDCISFEDMVERYSAEDVICVIPSLDPEEVDLDELQKFLLDRWGYFVDEEGRLDSSMAKAICVYDLFRFGPTSKW
ncbi:SIR2 family protein [Rhodococcus jostii]|uniref:SIR2 family protein n=1 Tax=Rhodococcus jostii TaxID=132919 RepID=UPI003656472B